jgi:hypothetical protein
MEHQNEAGRLARTRIVRIVSILAAIVTLFGLARRITGATILPNLTDSEIAGILVGFGVGTVIMWWWIGRRT